MMPALTDPELLTCYKNALANWRYEGYVVFTDLAQEWVRTNLPNRSSKDLGRLMQEYVAAGGEIDQQKETRPEWDAHEFHFDLAFPFKAGSFTLRRVCFMMTLTMPMTP